MQVLGWRCVDKSIKKNKQNTAPYENLWNKSAEGKPLINQLMLR